jgi:Mrp family chromosome partitioning ATPase
MSLATGQDTNALLVDCDFIAYSFTNRVNLLSATGLVDALLNPNMDIGSIMIKTDIPKLRIIPKGRHNPNALELLTSEKMQVLALELSTRYPDRFIIFDGPPLLFGNHGRALTATAGQILLVVAEGKTPTKDVKYAISLLGEDKMIGLVVNKSSCRCSSRF